METARTVTDAARLSTLLLLAASVSACSDLPTHPVTTTEPVTTGGPSASVSAAACRPVEGTISLPLFAPGVIDGTLEGVIVALERGPTVYPETQPAGRVLHGDGVWSIEITGGSVAWLEGTTVIADFKSQVGLLHPSHVDVRSTLALVEGAGGHLTLAGTFDFTTLVLEQNYRGTVCPTR